MYFVGKTIFQHKSELLILVLLTSILIMGNFHIPFTPNSQAIFLVPLILYLALKIYQGVDTTKYYFLLLLMCFLIVFYHPLVTLMVILILILMQIVQYLLEKYYQRIPKKANFIYIIFFMLTVFSIWSSYLFTLVGVVRPILGRLIFGDETVKSELQNNVDLLSKVMIDPLYLIKLILDVYGQWIILGMLSLLSIGLILNAMKNQKTELDFYQGISILGFFTFLLLSIAMLFINGTFDFGRVYSFTILFSLLLIPTGLYLCFYNNPDKKSSPGRMISILIGILFIIFWITYFSTFNLYYSPTIKYANQQVPTSDYIGMGTFFSTRDESLPIFELGIFSFRFFDAIYGVSVIRENIDYKEEKALPPDHFGYQNETLSRNFFENSKYIILNDKGRGFYQHVYPEFKNNWRFLPEDVEHLKSDSQVQLIYSNKNLEIFLL